ncbi:serine-rich adhesin for platelets-like [Zerene cesonia]|uniref:serine-rich adhesin for platelets-like n=1 Tax=Zerene cesonia TaxID=33412 RepID=UPI0018E58C74|nr:serine-rich adhesin for platelets-like [Zerene cesonia]
MCFVKLPLILLLLYFSYVITDEYDTTTEKHRKERVNGRIVKLYSDTSPESVTCHKEGFQADFKDCSVFYRCLKGNNEKYTVFRFQCAPGTIYDPEKELCNYPHSTRRADCSTELFSNEGKHENEIENVLQELPQPIKTTNVPLNFIDSKNPSSFEYYNELSENQHNISQYPPIISNTNDNTIPPHTIVSQNNKVTHSSNIPNQIKQEGEPCISHGFMGDTKNCKKFYRCVSNLRGGFIRYEFLCSDATIWDDSIQGCNHAWLARNTRCGRVNKYEEYTDTFGDKKQTEKLPSNADFEYKPQNNQGYVVNLMESEKGNDVLQNQSQAYGEVPTTTTSEIPQTTSTQITTSGYIPVQINYGDKILQNEYSPSHTPFSENEYNNNEEDVGSNFIIDQKKNDQCYKNGFFGYSDDCSKFYRCVESSQRSFTKYEFTCSEGTVWDDTIKACNFAWAVKECGAKKLTDNKFTTSIQFHDYNTLTTPGHLSDMNNGYGLGNEQSSTVFVDKSKITPESLVQSTTSNVIPDEEFYDYGGYQQNKNTISTENTNKIVNKPLQIDQKKCTKSGFMGDNIDCNKFYRCVESGKGTFIQYEFTCGEGTVWDARIESCNHEWAVEKCGDKSETDNNIRETTTTLRTSTINGFSTQGYYETTSLSKPTTSSPTKLFEPDENNNISISTTLQPNVNTESSHNVDAMSTVQDKCLMEGFYPNTVDCKKFYRCVSDGNGGYVKYEFSCGEGTAWDVTINSCNHMEVVKTCNIKQENEIYDESSPKPPTSAATTTASDIKLTSTQSTNTIQTTSTQSINTIQPKPENTCTEAGYFGDTNDCNKFYRCVNEGKDKFIKYEYTCGEGTIWDQDITACNHPQDVKRPSCLSDNLNSSTMSTSDSWSSTSTIQTQIITEPSSISTSTNVEKEAEAIEQTTKIITTSLKPTGDGTEQTCVEEGFYGDTNDCKQFYRCVYNGKDGFTKYDFTCGEGTIWDQDVVACNYPTDVEHPSCKMESTSTTMMTSLDVSSPSYSTTEKLSTTTMAISHSSSTQLSNEEGSTLSTVNGNNPITSTQQIIEHTTMNSESIKTSTEYLNVNNKDSCYNEGFFGSSGDCKKFYRCVYNDKDGFIKYDFTCGEGTIWDQEITACNHPEDVKNPSCSLESTDSSSTTSKDFTSSTNSYSSTTITSSRPSSVISSTTHSPGGENINKDDNVNHTTTEQQEKGNFTCSEAGFYPNPNDCKKFYRCVDWNNDGSSFSIFHFECGEGTLWDPTLNTCNYQDSVYPTRNCSGYQTTNNSESTSTESTTSDSTLTSTEESNTSTQQTTTSKQSTTPSITSTESTTTQQSITDDSTTTSQQTTSAEKSTTQSTISTTDQTTSSTSSSQETTTTQSTSSTTDQSTFSTASLQDTTTTQSTISTTDQSTSSTSSSQDTTTTERSITSTEQTTQTEKVTEESTTSDSTTQTSTTEQQSTSTTDTSTTENDKTTTESSKPTTESNSSNSKCPDMDDDQHAYVCPTSFRRHPKYCNIFYQCTEEEDSHDLKIALFHCPNGTIYDESKTQCLNESKSAKKCEGTMSRTHRIKRLSGDHIEPMTVSTKSYACPGTGYFPFEANQECSPAFLKCQRSRTNKFKGLVYKCPKDYVFWTVSKRCERTTRVRDCNKSVYAWNNRHDIPTEIRNVAP